MLRIFLFLVLFSASCWSYSYENCGKKKNSIVDIEILDVSPSPIKFPGNVTVSVKLTLKQDIPADAKMEMLITKKVELVLFKTEITLPCLRDVGSCTKNICEFIKGNEDTVCPFMPEDIECKCPLKASLYERHNMTVPLAGFGTAINLFVSGDYTYRFRILHDKKELVCVKMKLSLQSS